MAIEVSRYKTILWSVDPSYFQSTSHPISEWELYRLGTGYIPLENFNAQTGFSFGANVTLTKFRLKDLRAFIDIHSISPVVPIVPDPLDSEYLLAVKSIDNDLNYPAFVLELGLLNNEAGLVIVARLRLQNRRPGYFINLFKYFSNNADFLGDAQVGIVIRIINIGDGFPAHGDLIQVFGQVEELGYWLPKAENTLQLGGTINTVISGSLTTSGSGGTISQSSFNVSVNVNATHLLVYFVNDITQLSDLSGIVRTEKLINGIVNLSDILTLNTLGYYILIPSNIDANNNSQFVSSSIFTSTINPESSIEILSGHYSDTLNGQTEVIGCSVINVVLLPVNINLVLA
jgi:hypothetical protein